MSVNISYVVLNITARTQHIVYIRTYNRGDEYARTRAEPAQSIP